jgi:tRNA(Ile)-lysidine synthase
VDSFLEHVDVAIRQHRLLLRGQAVLVAVSGGCDSVVLLSMLHALAEKHRWQLTIAHLNHQLRGRSSDADERLVRRMATRLGLPVIVERANVRRLARDQKLSIEMAARGVRHEFLARAAVSRGISHIALAHHADDQVELFFLRLLRGTGSEGLAGMSWSARSPANRKLTLIRPLLELTRQQLRNFAVTNRLAFREDASNASLDFQRNRLRHELLPLLRRHYQPALEKVVLRLMSILGAEAQFINDSARDWLTAERTAGKVSGARSRGVTSFAQLPVGLQRRCVHLQLLDLGVTPEFSLVEQLRLQPGRPISISPKLNAVREPVGNVRLEPGRKPAFVDHSQTFELGAKGAASLNGLSLKWRIERGGGNGREGGGRNCEYFDAQRVGSPVTLRHWQPGDRFQPIGMQTTVKLQDFFINQRIPRGKRHELAIATTAAGDIFWVEGMRISERFKLTNRTIRRLHWAWTRV